MRSGILLTPRPAPGKLVPALAGAFVVTLALPVFLVAGWRVAGWALGAVLWAAAQGIGLLLARLPLGRAHLASSGVQAFGMALRTIAVMIVLIAVAVSRPHLALAALVVYALAYTCELGLSLLTYFGSER